MKSANAHLCRGKARDKGFLPGRLCEQKANQNHRIHSNRGYAAGDASVPRAARAECGAHFVPRPVPAPGARNQAASPTFVWLSAGKACYHPDEVGERRIRAHRMKAPIRNRRQ